VTDPLAPVRAALAKAHASRDAVPETVPRLPDLSRPAPVLPRHWGQHEDPFATSFERNDL
jgi:hypothetical protein